jgi:hypothetical protein
MKVRWERPDEKGKAGKGRQELEGWKGKIGKGVPERVKRK